MATATRPPVPVDVYLTGGQGATTGAGYVWSARDAFRVRSDFRLLGDFVGTLPKHTSQNQFLALPLVLSYDELVFGADRGLLRVLSDSPRADYLAPQTPAAAAAASQAFYVARDADFRRQAVRAVDAQEHERRRHATRAASSGKRPRPADASPPPPPKRARAADGGALLARVAAALRGVLRRFAPALVAADAHDARGGEDEGEEGEEAARARKDARRERALAQATAAAVTVTPTDARPGERGRAALAHEIPAPRGVSAERLRLRACVFRDLYAKGYYMSCGAKFGSDFLAYAGEPLLFHAALAVIVLRDDDVVTPHDVVALGRLGDATKKRTVLAFVDGPPDGVHAVRYVGVQWEETLP